YPYYVEQGREQVSAFALRPSDDVDKDSYPYYVEQGREQVSAFALRPSDDVDKDSYPYLWAGP
ncbi:MAG: hypothetical protein Q7S52_04240, partial [bacterium]|nr:hypothetical protein [bacterium]